MLHAHVRVTIFTNHQGEHVSLSENIDDQICHNRNIKFDNFLLTGAEQMMLACLMLCGNDTFTVVVRQSEHFHLPSRLLSL